MSCTQDSIENCSICRNSRNKYYNMAPLNCEHIFGYIGPPSNCNLKENLPSDKKIKSKHSKKSTMKFNKMFHPKNIGIKMEKNKKWIEPRMFSNNLNSNIFDDTKMRYDESDTDFKDFKNRRSQPESTASTKKMEAMISIKKSKETDKTQNKGKMTHRVIDSDLSCSTYTKQSSTVIQCISIDSIKDIKKKKKARRIDSEDANPKKASTSNCKNIKTSMKKKLPSIDSEFSIDSIKKLHGQKYANRNSSNSSMKVKNLKSAVHNLFGSIESTNTNKRKRKKYEITRIDSEDRNANIIKYCAGTKIKKPATAFTNSDFSVNSREKKKKKIVRKKRSTSSTDVNKKSKLKHSIFGSIESTKHFKKSKVRPNNLDAEDEMISRNPCLSRNKKSSKSKISSLKKKKKKKVSNCFICLDQQQHFDNKYFSK